MAETLSKSSMGRDRVLDRAHPPRLSICPPGRAIASVSREMSLPREGRVRTLSQHSYAPTREGLRFACTGCVAGPGGFRIHKIRRLLFVCNVDSFLIYGGQGDE
jgi:hypothetical protein